MDLWPKPAYKNLEFVFRFGPREWRVYNLYAIFFKIYDVCREDGGRSG